MTNSRFVSDEDDFVVTPPSKKSTTLQDLEKALSVIGPQYAKMSKADQQKSNDEIDKQIVLLVEQGVSYNSIKPLLDKVQTDWPIEDYISSIKLRRKTLEKTMSSAVDLKLADFARDVLPLETLAKKTHTKSEHPRNAVPAHKGGRKETPKHPVNPKAKLLKELHENKAVQEILKKHPKLDIIVVEKDKHNK